MPKAIFEALHCSRDARGLVFEPVDASTLPGQRNAHVVLTEPGGIRGNHRHEHNVEITVVIGPALVRLREEGQVREVNIPDGETWRVLLPVGVSHAFQNTGTKPMLLVAFGSQVFDPANPDVIRDVLI